MVVGHERPIPRVMFRVWERVELGSGLAARTGWVGMWPATRLDPK